MRPSQRPSQMDNRYNLWLSRLDEMDKETVKRTNGKQTLQSYQKAYADELWLTGTQAVTEGYADKIVTVRCDSSLSGTTSHSLSIFGLKVEYELDNCPINTSPMNIKVSSPDQEEISTERAKEVEVKFTEQYLHKHRAVVPMYW